jgi:hypothetical protein
LPEEKKETHIDETDFKERYKNKINQVLSDKAFIEATGKYVLNQNIREK